MMLPYVWTGVEKKKEKGGRARVRGYEGALRLMGVVVVVVRAANGRGVNKGVREGCGSKMKTLCIFTIQAMAKGDLRWSAVVVATKRCGPVARKVWRQQKGSFLCSPKGKKLGGKSVGVSCPLLLAGGKEVWWLMLLCCALIVSCPSGNCRSQ